MLQQPLRIGLTGGSGWLGRSLLALSNSPDFAGEFEVFGRTGGDIRLESGSQFRVLPIDVESMRVQEWDIFAPFAFLTRDKAIHLSEKEYLELNRKIINDASEIIRGGNIHSVINLSSGVVSQPSEEQKTDSSYSLYADLKKIQEEEFAKACASTGTYIINCRVFSLTGSDMQNPLKYAFGDLINQAKQTNRIVLNSTQKVIRRYMDSQELMQLLLLFVASDKDFYLESGGIETDLISLSKRILQKFGMDENSVSFKEETIHESNIYCSLRNDFEDFAQLSGIGLLSIDEQIANVEFAIDRATLIKRL